MWKLGLWLRNYFSGNICSNFSVLFLCIACTRKINQQTNVSLRRPVTTLYKGGHALTYHNLRKQVKKVQKIGHQTVSMRNLVPTLDNSYACAVQSELYSAVHTVYLHRKSQPQSTHRVTIASFWRTFHHDGKN
jgi:hypothetical protein